MSDDGAASGKSLGDQPARAADDKPLRNVSSASDVNALEVLEAIPAATILFDADRTLRFANRAAIALLDINSRRHGGAMSLETALAPVLEVARPLLRAVDAGLHGHVTTARITGTGASAASGGEQLVEIRFAPFGNNQLLFTATDVTAREMLLVSLERRARELAALFEVSPSTVRVLDAAGTIVRVNSNAIREHSGARPGTLAELWQRDEPQDYKDGKLLPLERHPGTLALAGETVRSRRLIVRRGNDDMRSMIELYSAPILDADRRVVGAVLLDRDVTQEYHLSLKLEEQTRQSSSLIERVSTESERLDRMVEVRSRELIAMQETRARERRLAAVGQLAAGVMHDVNNALNPIMAAAYLLLHHADDPSAVREYADRISKAAETGAATASRVGRFIRQEPMHADPHQAVDLSVAAEEVLSFTQPSFAEKFRTRGPFKVAREFVQGTTINGIAGEIREALLNLVQNSIDAMPNGGTLTISTGASRTEAWVSVSDTGEGMTEDVRDRAFEPFFSTKGSKGSGLGLAEVYGIARRHRGSAEIVSVAGNGTTVTLKFPHDAVSLLGDAPVVRAAVVPKRILVIEDHDDGREFLRQLLAADGHTVDAIATSREAHLRLAGFEPPPYDVIVTDIGLPDGSGWDIVRLARERWPALRVGVVTGWEPTLQGVGAASADFILRKPLRATELLANIAGVHRPESSE